MAVLEIKVASREEFIGDPEPELQGFVSVSLVITAYFRFDPKSANLETAIPYLKQTLCEELVGPDGKGLEGVEIISEVIEW